MVMEHQHSPARLLVVLRIYVDRQKHAKFNELLENTYRLPARLA